MSGIRSPAPGADRASLAVDVIIAGCGPTGAILAAELRLHDVRVLVLEKGRIVSDLDAQAKVALGEAEISAWIRGGRGGVPVEP